MAGGFDQEDEDGISGINVVPLVDIMLVLLIIFMVSTEFVQQELKNRIPPNIPVELPTASTSVDTEPSLLSLVLNHKGELFLNGNKSDLPAVKRYIDDLAAKGDKKVQAVIAADERITHGAVIELVDSVRLWGVDDFAINTKRQEIE